MIFLMRSYYMQPVVRAIEASYVRVILADMIFEKKIPNRGEKKSTKARSEKQTGEQRTIAAGV